MNIIKKTLKSIFLFILLETICITFPQYSFAACNFNAAMTVNNKNVSWSTTCTISTKEGVDNANGNEVSTSNTASLSLLSNGSVTINSTGSLLVGSLAMSGGSVAIQSGGLIKTGTPIFVADFDADGWAADFTFFEASSPGLRRLGVMKSTSTADCQDINAYNPGNCCGGVCYY